ncbi:MAG TPA: glutamate-5-semialdehyde dehydrogenase [Parvularculaceae bacterium]|nr:glutamate-5-semialdehyde dehydrogenase [Parvularculaceae bacterium]
MTETLEDMMAQIAGAARPAAAALREAPTKMKNAALMNAAARIEAGAEEILRVNAAEIAAANDLTPAFIDRMTLTPARIADIVAALKTIAALPDPVGATIKTWKRPNGLRFERVRTPIGVIAIIYESRPNVTVDAAAIAIKAGNAAILRGGSECVRTSSLLASLFRDGLKESGLPADALQFIKTTDRGAVGALLSGLDGAIDLVIPRGGKSLVARVRKEARVAVLSHLDGVCHVYLDRDADLDKAVSVAVNSKMRRTGVCGAAETLLIDRAKIDALLPPVAAALRAKGCELRGDETARKVDGSMAPASEEDFYTEYLAPIISIAAVDGVEGAIAHIARYGSSHTETIVTESAATAERFLKGVDSAIVLHNASTQFADGGEFGFGAEIGIATGRLHARGPVGVEELTTFKTLVRGYGQVRP